MNPTTPPNPDTHCPACHEPLSEYGHCWQHHYPPMDPAQDSPTTQPATAAQPMTELQSAYQHATNAVRAYAKLVQAEPPQQRPPMLFVAEDICDGETCDCIMSGKISAVSDALASACVVAPSLAAAIVVCAEAGDVSRAALQYVAGKVAN